MVWTTVSNRRVGRQLAESLLRQRLAACVHLCATGESAYWWKGKLERTKEIPLMIKTSQKALPLLLKSLKKEHPYETPEILAIRVDRGDPSYVRWLLAEARPQVKKNRK